jgi:preprotein translocase subunit SecA
VTSYVEGATAKGYAEEWDLDQLWTALRTLYPISLTEEEAIQTAGGNKNDITREFLVEEIRADAAAAYDQREEELTPEVMRELERRVLLSVVDRKWREHLYEMDYLREGIGLRAMGQRDPLVEYQREGYDMFAAMMDAIKEESVGFLFNLEVEVDDSAAGASEAGPEIAADAPVMDDAAPGTNSDLAALVERIAAGEGLDSRPQVKAKGLERTKSATPLTYSAPELGSETPEVTVGDAAAAAGDKAETASARRQQSRSNPNRGSRGNKPTARKRRR